MRSDLDALMDKVTRLSERLDSFEPYCFRLPNNFLSLLTYRGRKFNDVVEFCDSFGGWSQNLLSALCKNGKTDSNDSGGEGNMNKDH